MTERDTEPENRGNWRGLVYVNIRNFFNWPESHSDYYYNGRICRVNNNKFGDTVIWSLFFLFYLESDWNQ
jgi:hypothetical protein